MQLYVMTSEMRRLHRRIVTGNGHFDWLSGVTSFFPRASFLSANKDNLKRCKRHSKCCKSECLDCKHCQAHFRRSRSQAGRCAEGEIANNTVKIAL
jgi:hypothetical protein